MNSKPIQVQHDCECCGKKQTGGSGKADDISESAVIMRASAEPVARLLHWHGPSDMPVPHGGIAARTFAEYSAESADKPDSYWKNGAPLYTAPQPDALDTGLAKLAIAPRDERLGHAEAALAEAQREIERLKVEISKYHAAGTTLNARKAAVAVLQEQLAAANERVKELELLLRRQSEASANILNNKQKELAAAEKLIDECEQALNWIDMRNGVPLPSCTKPLAAIAAWREGRAK